MERAVREEREKLGREEREKGERTREVRLFLSFSSTVPAFVVLA